MQKLCEIYAFYMPTKRGSQKQMFGHLDYEDDDYFFKVNSYSADREKPLQNKRKQANPDDKGAFRVFFCIIFP